MSRNKPKHGEKTPLANPKNNRSKGDNNDASVYIHGAIVAHPPDSLLHQHNAERKEDAATHKTERKEDSARESKKLFLEWLTFIAVFFYAVVALWQGCLTRESISNTQDNFIKDQTPYIWITPQPPVVTAGEHFRWDVHYSNYGRSPAINLHTCVGSLYGATMDSISTIHFPSGGRCDNKTTPPTSLTVVPPGFPGYASSFDQAKVLTPEDVSNIKGHDGGAILYGVIMYEDSTGHSFETGFCAYRLQSGALANCEKYNYIKQTK
jgi:hypothetical protein